VPQPLSIKGSEAHHQRRKEGEEEAHLVE